MRGLSASDLRLVTDIGYTVAECRGQAALQQDAVSMIQSALSADSSVYVRVNENPRGTRFMGSAVHGHSEGAMTTWCARYQPLDPFVEHFLRCHSNPSERVFSSNKVIAKRDLLASRFYQEFLEPNAIFHVLLVGLTAGSRPLGALGFHRPKSAPAFSEREIAIAEMIAPCFSMATLRAHGRERIHECEHIINYLAETALNQKLMVLNEELRPLFVSDGLAEMLGSDAEPWRDCWSVEQLIPCRELMRRCNVLRQQADPSMRQVDPLKFQIKLVGEEGPLNAILRATHWGPAGPRFMLSFHKSTETGIAFDVLASHGLTARQADIAQLLYVGLTNAEIAAKLYISTRTVENHLRAIYEKCGVNNRTSLIYRLASRTY